MSAPRERLHYMDHLRALAMLAGVFFHAALAYSPLMRGFFPTSDRQSSAWVDGVVWGLHLFRMPLFFVVAGFFAASVIGQRGGAAFARQRVRRIALPFLVAWPLVGVSLSAAVAWAVDNVQHPSAFLIMAREWMRTVDAPRTPLSTSHLWFLYYLLLLAVLHWAARTLEIARASRWVLTRQPAWLLLGLPLLLAPALASVSAPHPAPEGLLPQFWALAFYGAFYALGTLLHGAPSWMERARACTPWLLVGSASLYAVFLWRLSIELPGASRFTASWLMAVLEACLSVWLTVLCLVAGQRLLDRRSVTMLYLAKSAYWTYLWHLPLLFAIQFVLMDSTMAWPLKFALSSGTTLMLCLLSYELMVRHTPLRRFVG